MKSVLTMVLVAMPFALRAQEATPPGLMFAASAVDAGRGRMVLFSGVTTMTSDDASSETWEFDGQRWHRMAPAASPPGRAWHAMAYDAARRRVVLFGGVVASGQQMLADTWEYDGTRWTRGPDGPPARAGHVMFYAQARGGVVLMGGTTSLSTATAVNDEWLFDGRAWRQLRGPDPAAVAAAETARLGDTRTRAFRAAMRSDLRNLVTAQESFFADHVRYSGSLDSLQFRPTTGVTVRFVKVQANAWSGIATHSSVPDLRCGIFVGAVEPPFAEVRNEGEPACVP